MGGKGRFLPPSQIVISIQRVEKRQKRGERIGMLPLDRTGRGGRECSAGTLPIPTLRHRTTAFCRDVRRSEALRDAAPPRTAPPALWLRVAGSRRAPAGRSGYGGTVCAKEGKKHKSSKPAAKPEGSETKASPRTGERRKAGLLLPLGTAAAARWMAAAGGGGAAAAPPSSRTGAALRPAAALPAARVPPRGAPYGCPLRLSPPSLRGSVTPATPPQPLRQSPAEPSLPSAASRCRLGLDCALSRLDAAPLFLPAVRIPPFVILSLRSTAITAHTHTETHKRNK